MIAGGVTSLAFAVLAGTNLSAASAAGYASLSTWPILHAAHAVPALAGAAIASAMVGCAVHQTMLKIIVGWWMEMVGMW